VLESNGIKQAMKNVCGMFVMRGCKVQGKESKCRHERDGCRVTVIPDLKNLDE